MKLELKKYILANYQSMTTAEMAEGFGIESTTVSNMLNKMKLRAVSKGDRVRDHIKANPGSTVEDIAEKFGLSREQIWAYARQVGVKLSCRWLEEEKDWLTYEDSEKADRRLEELKKDPRVIKWLEDNDFEV